MFSLFNVLQAAGMKIGDYLLNVSKKDVRGYRHEQVINLINMVVDVVRLRIITPIYRDDIKVIRYGSLWGHSKYCLLVLQKSGSKKQFFGLKSITVPKIFNNSTPWKSAAPLALSHDEESLASSSEFSVSLRGSWNSRMSWTESTG
jgi:hypothetical protein